MPSDRPLLFSVNDNTKKDAECAGMELRTNKQTVLIALDRLRLLLSDMGWTDDNAIALIYQSFREQVPMSKKGIEHWFSAARAGIPAEHIFNVSTIFGVDAGWLAGQNHLTKKQAIRPIGAYSQAMNIREITLSSRKKRAR